MGQIVIENDTPLNKKSTEVQTKNLKTETTLSPPKEHNNFAPEDLKPKRVSVEKVLQKLQAQNPKEAENEPSRLPPTVHLPPIIKYHDTQADLEQINERLGIKKFNKNVALEVIRRIINGVTVTKILKDGVVDGISYQHWKRIHPEFKSAIITAKKMRSEILMENLLEKAQSQPFDAVSSKFISNQAGLENPDYNPAKLKESLNININNQPTIIQEPFSTEIEMDIEKFSVTKDV